MGQRFEEAGDLGQARVARMAFVVKEKEASRKVNVVKKKRMHEEEMSG
jgi:hypothetical protein